MPATIRERGAGSTFQLLREIADRARDLGPVYGGPIADKVFDFQRRWWLIEYGDRTDKDERPGRDPRYMRETGGLEAAATVRGSARQQVNWTGLYLLVEVTHGLARIHEDRGRPVLGEPGQREATHYAEIAGDYILTGRL